MTAFLMLGEMSLDPTRMRFWLLVSFASCGGFAPFRVGSATTTEFLERLYSARFSSGGRSLDTAIIIPKTVDTSARPASPARITARRSFLSFGLAGAGTPPLGPEGPPVEACGGRTVVGGSCIRVG